MKANRDVIIANSRRHFYIHDWLNYLWIAECDIAPFQPVFGSVEGDITLSNIHSPQYCGIGSRTADAQVNITGDFGQRSLHSQLRSRNDADVESQTFQKRVL